MKSCKAFGEWSLPSKKTQVERFLEEQLDKAFDFYKNEVEVRSWYGMFNYGDIMHTYDHSAIAGATIWAATHGRIQS